VFPHPASELTNGAMRRTNSAYFSFCNSHHLPDNTDLVIIEFDADDPNDRIWMEHFELLVRSILVRPDQPAVVVLGHFNIQGAETHGYSGPEVQHSVVAQYYDVPHISTKPLLYPSWVANPESVSEYFADPVLANPTGHDLLAEVLTAYFQSQVCSAWSVVTGHTFDAASPLLSDDSKSDKPEGLRGLFGGLGHLNGPDEGISGGSDNIYAPNPHMNIPMGRINTKPSDRRDFEEVQPFCVSANDLINPLPPSLFHGSGWLAHHPAPGSSSLNVQSHYWYSTLPQSKLRVPIQVGNGDVAVYYLKEPAHEVEGSGSAIECWVDDNYAGASMLANAADIGEVSPTMQVIDRFVTRGSHFVECQLMGDEGRPVPSFRLLGIFAS